MENDQSIKPCSVYMKLDPSLSPDTLDPSEASKQDRFKEEMQYTGNFCATLSTLWIVSSQSKRWSAYKLAYMAILLYKVLLLSVL